jgi:hypothetical protein
MKKYKFKAKIEAGDGGGAYVLFPYDTSQEFGTKGHRNAEEGSKHSRVADDPKTPFSRLEGENSR